LLIEVNPPCARCTTKLRHKKNLTITFSAGGSTLPVDNLPASLLITLLCPEGKGFPSALPQSSANQFN
jgi:hypothetical protein